MFHVTCMPTCIHTHRYVHARRIQTRARIQFERIVRAWTIYMLGDRHTFGSVERRNTYPNFLKILISFRGSSSRSPRNRHISHAATQFRWVRAIARAAARWDLIVAFENLYGSLMRAPLEMSTIQYIWTALKREPNVT